jgi:hypothetical protein
MAPGQGSLWASMGAVAEAVGSRTGPISALRQHSALAALEGSSESPSPRCRTQHSELRCHLLGSDQAQRWVFRAAAEIPDLPWSWTLSQSGSHRVRSASIGWS